MPVRKHYECADTFNTLKVGTTDFDSDLLLTIKDETDYEIQIMLTRMDLLDLITELESYNELLFEIEKGGKNV